jgi:tetratricopeptide (TPR) repeat protein/GGDEF domain-containing protein
MKYSAGSKTGLCRHDLIELEDILREGLARFFPFASHGLYFPCEKIPHQPQWLPREHRLLLPLAVDGQTLGVFVAGGVAARDVRPLLPALPGITALCLENLILHKRARRDGLTELATREALLSRVVNELERSRQRHPEDVAGPEPSPPLHWGGMGLLVVRCAGMAELGVRHGRAFADQIRRELAAALLALCPQGILAARCAEDECALLLHEAAARTACERLGAALLHGLDGFACTSPLTQQSLRPRLSAGYAVYPQDIEGEYFLQSYEEQAVLLLAKARLAARVAGERLPDEPEQTTLMPYSAVLREGGFVREVLPLSRMTVSLGFNAGAQPGMRFSIWPPFARDARDPRCKGELMLLEPKTEFSFAELIQVEDPVNPPEPGDRLRLIVETPRPLDGLMRDPPLSASPVEEETPDEHGLLSSQSFQTRLAAAGASAFCLALLHVAPGAQHPLPKEALTARVVAACREHARFSFAARYGTQSFLFFHSESAVDKLAESYGAALRELDIQAAVGLASFPCLHFQRGEELIVCCSKALELARLLPAPHVGVFGSKALNISADKHYYKGEFFKAIEEYEGALLADKDNANAWNSLGFCMAFLSRHHEAQRYFTEALKRNPDDVVALYNLGMACLNLGKDSAAARHFRACLKRRPDYVFAHIRLGQLAAKTGRPAAARRRFLQAAEHKESAGLAHRLLARLALRGNDDAQAREYLHKALQCNPQDAPALHMLARLYLDCGEDPAVAEMLARKSVALMPDLAAAWQELGRALKAQGRGTEAAAARARAARI